MKKTRFLKLVKCLCLTLTAVGAVLTTATTLSSCGGGSGESGTNFVVTPSQFYSGSRSFYILSRATFLVSGGASDFISPDSVDSNASMVEGQGTIQYDGLEAPIPYTYYYDSSTRTAKLYFSVEAVESTAGISKALWNYCVKNAEEDHEEGGTISGGDRSDDELYWQRSHIDFNFVTSQCRVFYDDSTYSQWIDFRIKNN